MSNQDKWLDDMAGYSILFPEAAKRLKAHVESQRKELEMAKAIQEANTSIWNSMLSEQDAVVAQVEAENVLLKRELEELRHSQFIKSSARNLAEICHADCVAQVETMLVANKELRELCGELVRVVEVKHSSFDEWFRAKEDALAKAKERIK